ncbi:MAG: hypothetical protein NC347_00260 [Clostridium sp.]|nr:hypothetical protein [Clostridium sp.]
MRTYRIYKNKLAEFKFVCKRDGLEYEICLENDGLNFFEAKMDISRGRFKELIDDIDCEIQRKTSSHPEAPVISYRTMMQPQKFARLIGGQRIFRSLHRDQKKFSEI